MNLSKTMTRSEFKEVLQIISSDLHLTEEHDLDLCEWGKKVKRVAVNAWELEGEARGQYIQCPMGQIYGGPVKHLQAVSHLDNLGEFPGVFDSYMSIRLNLSSVGRKHHAIVEIVDD